MAIHQPFVNGMRLGTLVEVNGLTGQFAGYAADEGKCEVALISGGVVAVEAAQMKVPPTLKKPGAGGDDSSFDVLVGPQTKDDTLAVEMATCLFEKGFCVLKVCQDMKELELLHEGVREAGDEGLLGRLPEEVEAGYMGTHGRGKVVWLDPDDPTPFHNELLESCNKKLSHLAALLQPFSEDALGKCIEERTPALVSLSLQEDEEQDYPLPMADDKTLGDYLGVWRRGLLRAVHFLGPEVAALALERREGTRGLVCKEENISISAGPGTLLLFRPDCYEYECVTEGEVLSLTASFLAQAPQFRLSGWDGDPKALELLCGGPPPPAGDRISVLHTSTRLAACWDETEMFNAGLRSACDTSIEIPYARFDVEFYFCHDPDELLFGPPRTVQRHTSYVEGINLFDNKYFEISNNEATGMDPLQRQVLEVGGTCLYAHGITKKVSNRTSHHAGCSVGLDKADFPTLGIDTGSSSGNNALAIASNRFSFVFNLKGPNYICDTACSASLTATHLAKLALLERVWDPLEFHVALGTHACLAIGPWIGTSIAHMVSPQGRCFSFSASANGYLRGEGTSGMLLKYGTEQHEPDCAIYRASQCGQDGRSATLTAPNGPAQEQIIDRAIKEARMTPPESSSWECHGTGTSLGDPIEVGAVKKIQIKHQRLDPLAMTTSKSNIGHLEGGAGMAAMVKCVVQVLRCECQPTLHLGQLNPHLEHTTFDAFFATDALRFSYGQGHSHVSSFGFGGSNGHVVFWGKGTTDLGSMRERILKRLRKMSLPEVRPLGHGPDEWESDLPEADVRPGDVYKISISSDDPPDAQIKWVLQSRQPEEEEDSFYCITGNFNEWKEDRMEIDSQPGHHLTVVEVPDSGVLEFRFLKDGDENQILAPEIPSCSKKLVPIQGPKAGLTNAWKVTAIAGSSYQIELTVVKGSAGVLWFRTED